MDDLKARGEQCEWCGKLAKDMTRDELLAFIGQLDWTVEFIADMECGE